MRDQSNFNLSLFVFFARTRDIRAGRLDGLPGGRRKFEFLAPEFIYADSRCMFVLIFADAASRAKAEKIRLALEKMREASVQKLFIKAFTLDGSGKSLLVDEGMSVAHVSRLLADKNHVPMDPKWAVVEHLPDLFMGESLSICQTFIISYLPSANCSTAGAMVALRRTTTDV